MARIFTPFNQNIYNIFFRGGAVRALYGNTFTVIYSGYGEYYIGMDNRCIAFCDSGIGGLILLKKTVAAFPDENFIYFADSSNLPYGDKTGVEMEKIADSAIRILISFAPKIIVTACSSLSTFMSENRRDYGVKIVGVYPVARKGNGYVFCTPRTAKSECAEILRKNGSKVVGIHGLADEIERAVILGEKPDVKPFFDEFDRDAEYVSLGCTHYGFIKEELSEIFPRAKLIDGNDEAENEIRSFLSDHPREGGGGEVCFIGKKSDIIAEIYSKIV